MRKQSFILVALLFFYFSITNTFSQVSIIHANINEYNISPNSLKQISVSNVGGVGKVKFEISITNSANKILLSLTSATVDVQSGLTVFGVYNLSFVSINYSKSPQGDYIKNMHRLPNGAFNYCVRLIPVLGLENGDDYCQSLNTTSNDQLILVTPSDEEVIDSKTPMLLWLHTEAFNLLSEGEFFRLTLVEVFENQKGAEAIFVNTPHFLKKYVTRHHVQYPFDARKLEAGHHYAWHVQKISNGNIIASTEVWSFSLTEKNLIKNVAITLKTKLDGTIYYVENDMIFFRFDERYKSSEVVCRVFNDKREEFFAELKNTENNEVANKVIGYNSYKLDLEPYKLKKGYYTLEVLNEKNEKHLIKFYVD